MNIRSPYWDEGLGVCEKHGVPCVPCPQCLAEHDAEVVVQITETDYAMMAIDPDFSIRDMLPAEDGDWLLERIM